jgi:hypothetical protein
VAMSISPATVTMAHPASRRTRMVRSAVIPGHPPASARSHAAAARPRLIIISQPLHASVGPGR